MQNEFLEYSKPINVLTNEAFQRARYSNQLKNLSGYQKFQSISEYQNLLFPLLQNETYCSLKREESRFLNCLKNRDSFPLVFEIILNDEMDPSREQGIKFDILKEYEQMKNESASQDELWKYTHFAQYLLFKQSSQYFGVIYTKKPDRVDQYFSSLAIFVYKEKQEEKSFILPFTKEATTMLKFENIFTTHEKLIEYQKKIIQYEETLKYKSYRNQRIWDQQLIVYFQPICPLSAYLNEKETIFQLSNCPFWKLILNPCQMENKCDSTIFSIQARQEQQKYFNNNVYRQYFNENQLDAIREALDFTQKITIVKGPPGTGKTQTTIGIIAIMSELLIKSKENPQGAILLLAKSNSVVNDLVRKIHNNIENKNSIIFCFDYKPDYLKVVRFGRPEKCDSDIYRMSLEIRSQNHFFQHKFKNLVREYEAKYITSQIKSKLKKKSLEEFREYLQLTEQQYTLISLLSYIEDLNFKTKNKNILDAYGDLYCSLSQLLKHNKKQYTDIEQDYLSQCHVIVSTLNSCSKECLEKFFETVKLRMCIIDEAPTALEPSLLIPFVKYKSIEKVVLLGDTRQLNPIVISSESNNYNFNRSLFQRLAKGLKQNSYKLTFQYRQMPNLAEITSALFYKNKLINGIENMQFPPWIKQKISDDRNRLFFSAPSQSESCEETSKKNDIECQAIILLVQYLLNELTLTNHQKPITIISAYRAQTENIHQSLKTKTFKMKKSEQEYRTEKLIDYVELDTVDSFQGKENDIIILSLVRSNNQQGFLKDKKRTNVALSRARFCQYIFGTRYTMKLDLKNWNKVMKLFEKNNEIIKYNEESLNNPNFFKEELKKD
ncbi:unnamed protein product [Paramecium sonneborni]|uniref:Uncharacterized protein n=1 Tax=Paramecium sonneborni TaxID=65129 RepID=A0A8S1P821_9CILI|nr:unnamed protein product [Paramecium sonneborni]